MAMKYLVTGAAGFIGYHVCKALLLRGEQVVGLDNLNEYYDPQLKKARIERLSSYDGFSFACEDLVNYAQVKELFSQHAFDKACHLAAQAGVRYSLQNPFAYQKSNLEGFLNILELCRCSYVRTVVYASSSSVYGLNEKLPFSIEDRVDHPVSLYAATKRANELMAHAYHHLFNLNCTGLRLFTVYGPWGRPDMALFKFAKAILEGRELELYNFGNMQRDFTYIDDVVSGVLAALDREYPYEIFNLGCSQTVELTYVIDCLERELGVKAEIRHLPLQAGDVAATHADISHSTKLLGYVPKTSIDEGIAQFVDWYLRYHSETRYSSSE